MQLGSGEEAEYDLGEEKDGGKNDAKKGRDKVQPVDSFEFGAEETHNEDAGRGNNNRKVSIKCPRKAPPTWRQMQRDGRYEERRGGGGMRRGEGRGGVVYGGVCGGGGRGGRWAAEQSEKRVCGLVYSHESCSVRTCLRYE